METVFKPVTLGGYRRQFETFGGFGVVREAFGKYLGPDFYRHASEAGVASGV